MDIEDTIREGIPLEELIPDEFPLCEAMSGLMGVDLDPDDYLELGGEG